jgi:hypothetical protein
MFSSFSFFAALPDLSMISLRVKNTGRTRLPDEPQLRATLDEIYGDRLDRMVLFGSRAG